MSIRLSSSEFIPVAKLFEKPYVNNVMYSVKRRVNVIFQLHSIVSLTNT